MRNNNVNSGAELWRKAKRIIPGGNQLLSKRAEMFLPDGWPAYYKKAKGIKIWDMDDNELVDMSIMGIGSCILGYANEEVNRAVIEAVDKGSMSTLNCYEEQQLAEKLIALHNWADMVRFARTGGEACAIAVRIARVASGKDKVAFCGYHGWHDWYLASNLANDKNLDGHLLPGLEPLGVPRALKGSAIPFSYGNSDELESIISGNDIGVIITEVERYKELDLNFLNYLKKTAERIGAVLIFDEISSGFRLRAGGMHMLHDISPDIVILGKAMGNGFPISAIVGTKEIMDTAQKTFISSTYWTERIGYRAALKVIDIFERDNVPAYLVEIGTYFKKQLQDLFNKKGLNAEVIGLPPVPTIAIKEEKPLTVKTYFTQEMLKKGYLSSNLTYISYAHNKKIINKFINEAAEVVEKAVKGLREGNLEDMLEYPACHSGFKRLN